MGAMFVGVLLSAAIWGVNCIQINYYFNWYRTDPIWMKAMVVLVWMIDTSQLCLLIGALYRWIVEWYGNVQVLLTVGNLAFAAIPFLAINHLVIQMLYIHRIFCFKHLAAAMNINPRLFTSVLVVLVLLSLASFAASVLYCAKLGENLTFAHAETLRRYYTSVFALTTACDILITISMAYILQTGKTGFRKTSNIVNKLIMYTISSGLLTSCFTLATLILGVVLPNDFIYIAMEILAAKVITSTFLALINSRKSIRDQNFGASTRFKSFRHVPQSSGS